MQPWHHYVAIDDSFTKGVGDSVDGFAELGVMDRLAAVLRQSNPDLHYTNLANSGLLLAEIREQQLETALQLTPDFESVVAGGNDILTGQFDEARLEQEFRALYESLTQSGAVVVTGNVPNFPLLRTLFERSRTGRSIQSGIAAARRFEKIGGNMMKEEEVNHVIRHPS